MLKRIKEILHIIPLKMYVVYLGVALFLVIGVTFSKYISTTTGADSARLAKFGELQLEESNSNEKFLIIPGENIQKDPKVSFVNNEMSTFVFVSIVAEGWSFSNLFGKSTFTIKNEMTWEVDNESWTFLSYDDTNKRAVFYQLVSAGEEINDVSIIKNDSINVSNKIKNSQLDEIELIDTNILFKAYAVQSSGFENVDSAWNSLKNK